MRLPVGGKPSGSSIIMSGDGTATVSHYYRNSTGLYQFDLPYDAGKVLDASIAPSADDNEEGAWVVLTEKARIWAIPEKAVILGGFEPPEWSLSHKGSSNERSTQEDIRNLTFAGNVAPRRASSEAWGSGDRQRAVLSGIACRSAQDEESEALSSHLFNNFLSSGQIDRSLEKLEASGSFERDGETGVLCGRANQSLTPWLNTGRQLEVQRFCPWLLFPPNSWKSSRNIKIFSSFLPYRSATRSCVLDKVCNLPKIYCRSSNHPFKCCGFFYYYLI